MRLSHRFQVELAAGEFDVDATLRSGQVFRFHRLGSDRWVGVDGPHVFSIRSETLGSGVQRLDVESNANESLFRSMFRIDVSFSEVAEALSASDGRLHATLSGIGGLRQVRAACPTETLFCFLCTANNHLPRIRSMIESLTRLGHQLGEIDGVAIRAFPEPEAIASAGEPLLRELGFGYRAGTIVRVAGLLAERGPGWLDGLRERGYAAAFEELQGLPGIGPKLADCICLYGLHFDEAVPVDTHLWQAACQWFFPEWRGQSLTPARYQAIGNVFRTKFGGLAGWAQLILYYGHMASRGKNDR